ncbi:MAG: hypothetical protein ABIP17_11510 [Ilumatobacteraceae bacterium]
MEIAAAIEELRSLAHGLRPALLQAGLGPALQDLAGSKLSTSTPARGREPSTFEYAAMEREASVDTRNRKTGGDRAGGGTPSHGVTASLS